jgi:glutamine---fructose-6-phosphate transaminase (isomerizing)
LEYRGYDSAGLAVLQNSHIEVRRDAGKLAKLVGAGCQRMPVEGKVGIRAYALGYARRTECAQCAPAPQQATGKVVVVHNGIVENFLELREELNGRRGRVQIGDGYRNDRSPDRALSVDAETGLWKRRCARR